MAIPATRMPDVPGAIITVKNTFLVAEEENEGRLRRIARRRAVRSCPIDFETIAEEEAASPVCALPNAVDEELPSHAPAQSAGTSPCNRRRSRMDWASLDIDGQDLFDDAGTDVSSPSKMDQSRLSELILLQKLMGKQALTLQKPPSQSCCCGSMSDCMPDEIPSPSRRTSLELNPTTRNGRRGQKQRKRERRRQQKYTTADAEAFKACGTDKQVNPEDCECACYELGKRSDAAGVSSDSQLQWKDAYEIYDYECRWWNATEDTTSTSLEASTAVESHFNSTSDKANAKEGSCLAGERAGRRRRRQHKDETDWKDEKDTTQTQQVSKATARRFRDVSSTRTWCQIYLDEDMLLRGFDLVQKLIGRSGCNTRAIFEKTGTKVRIRGRGSGHHEDYGCGGEAHCHLMMALTADPRRKGEFWKAVEMACTLLDRTVKDFEKYTGKKKAERFWMGNESEDVPSLIGSTSSLMSARRRKQ